MSKTLEEKMEALGKLYEQMEAYWATSSRDDAKIEERRHNFLLTHKRLIDGYIIKHLNGVNDADFTDVKLTGEHHLSPRLAAVLTDYKKEPSRLTADDNAKENFAEAMSWIYRNFDKAGREFMGSEGSSHEFIESSILNAKPEVLKRMFFLLETDQRKRKAGDRTPMSDAEFLNYRPNIEKIKEKMIASPAKFWKRTNGSYLYWNKLKDAFEKASLEINDPVNAHTLDNQEVHGQSAGEGIMELNSGTNTMMGNYGDVDKGIMNTEAWIKGRQDPIKMTDAMGSAFQKNETKLTKGLNVHNGITDLGGGMIGFISSGQEMLEKGKNLHENFSAIRNEDKVKEVSDILGAVNGAVSGVTTTISGAASLAKAVSGSGGRLLEATANISGHVGFVGDILKTVSGAITWHRSKKGMEHSENAKKFAKELTGSAEKKKLIRRADMLAEINRKNKHNGIADTLGGNAGIIADFVVVLGLMTPVVGQIMSIIAGIASLVSSGVTQIRAARGKRRTAIDFELMEAGDKSVYKLKKQDLANKISRRFNTLRPGVQKLIRNRFSVSKDNKVSSSHKHHLGNILRRETAADKGFLNMFQAFDGVMRLTAKEAVEATFGEDGLVLNENTPRAQKQRATKLEANREILRAMHIRTKKKEGETKEQRIEKAQNIAASI